jgi:hypothetical protein
MARGHYLKICRLLKTFSQPVLNEDAFMRYQHGVLTIDMGGVQVGGPASGSWPPLLRVPSQAVKAMCLLPPLGDTLVFQYDGSKVRIDDFSMRATVGEPIPDSRPTHIGVTDHELLIWAVNQTDGTLRAAGYQDAVDTAWAKAETAIRNATSELRDYDIRTEDIRRLVVSVLKSQIARG